MKTKKRRMEFISFYNHTGLEKHFAKMAKKGWLIESMTKFTRDPTALRSTRTRLAELISGKR